MTSAKDRSATPQRYSAEWFQLWATEAEELLEALEKYEDEHPKGAPCLVKAMDAAGAEVIEWQDRHKEANRG